MKSLLFTCLLLCGMSCKPATSPTQSETQPPAIALSTPRTILADSNLTYVTYSDSIIVVTNATIIDGTGSPAKKNQTLVVANGIIRAVGPNSEITIPSNATLINAESKTIIPGIVGVHNHLHMPGSPFLGGTATRLYLAAGVTTIQTCGAAEAEMEVELAERIQKGKAIGPDIYTSGPYFTGAGGNPNMIIPTSEQQIRDTIQYWTKRGVRWFKAYRNTTPKHLAIIIDEAHKQNAKVTGHFCSITFEAATTLGIDGIEHGLNSTSDFRTNKTPGVCDGGRAYMDELVINSNPVKRLHQLMIDSQVFLTSTLAIYESSIAHRALAEDRALEIMSPIQISSYEERRNRLSKQNPVDTLREKRLKRIMEFEYQFFKMGGLLTAGVDPGRHVLPGFGDQRNFELFREAAFTTEEAIQIMTGNGAKALSASKIGTLEAGKRADFVILNGDLKNDPTAIKNVEWVFKEGYGYDSEALLKELTGKLGQVF